MLCRSGSENALRNCSLDKAIVENIGNPVCVAERETENRIMVNIQNLEKESHNHMSERLCGSRSLAINEQKHNIQLRSLNLVPLR